MIKCHVVTSWSDEEFEHTKNIATALEKIDECGHTFISLNTIVFSPRKDSSSRLRTEIVYRENHVRKVITEKQK